MRLEPTTNTLSVLDLGKFCKDKFWTCNFPWKIFSSRGLFGLCCSGTDGRRPQPLVSADGQRLSLCFWPRKFFSYL